MAPLFEDAATRRRVYLPSGAWIDYQTGATHAGGTWREIAAGAVPIVLLVRDHAVIPHAAVAQSTSQIDWTHPELRVFATDGAEATGLVPLPDEAAVPLRVRGGRVEGTPLDGRVRWRLTWGRR